MLYCIQLINFFKAIIGRYNKYISYRYTFLTFTYLLNFKFNWIDRSILIRLFLILKHTFKVFAAFHLIEIL